MEPYSRRFLVGLFGLPERVKWFWPLLSLALIAALVIGAALRARSAPNAGTSRRRVFTIGLAALPLAWCLVFGLELAVARILTGTWPFPRHGSFIDGTYVDSSLDPKELGFLHWA